ncbi:MAG TPA: hypothetical protein VGU43_06780 [Thermoplasmata archaeon]|nr:hypothetical protein [Thermoplasmata archaeon]
MSEPEPGVPPPTPWREKLRRSVDPSVWVGIGAVGLVLFVIGVYIPALRGVPGAVWLRYLFAIAGGMLGMLGFSFWWEGRQEPPRASSRARRRGASAPPAHPFGPSFEVYRPPPREGGPLLRRPPPS